MSASATSPARQGQPLRRVELERDVALVAHQVVELGVAVPVPLAGLVAGIHAEDTRGGRRHRELARELAAGDVDHVGAEVAQHASGVRARPDSR